MAIDSGATAWVLASTALVMIMTPGVGFFYGGLVRKKNFIDMITLSFVAFALVSIQWVLIGYSLAFGPDVGGFIGNLSNLGLNGVSMSDPGPYSTLIPGLLYMVFQLVFATVTMAIVTSGFAERIKFSAYLVFALLWTTIVYDPLAHWVWGGGWTSQFGSIDFAGGTVVHISSGFAALALALVIGKRVGFGKYAMEPANIPWSILGAALLWFGWFGFNCGKCSRSKRPCSQRICHDQHGNSSGSNGMAPCLLGTRRQAELAWVCQWCSSGTCCHHPGSRVCDPDGIDRDRCSGRCHLLRDHALAAGQGH